MGQDSMQGHSLLLKAKQLVSYKRTSRSQDPYSQQLDRGISQIKSSQDPFLNQLGWWNLSEDSSFPQASCFLGTLVAVLPVFAFAGRMQFPTFAS